MKIALQEALKNDLFLFCKFLGYTDITENSHRKITDTLSSSSKKKLLCLPRGSFKSSIASVAFPLWLIIKHPDIRILIDSEIYTNSKNFLREIKAHIEKPLFIAVFGHIKGQTWSEGEIIITTRKKPLKEPTIACAGVETTKVGMHFDVVIMDDLCSDQNTMNEEQREKVTKHYQMNTSILEPGGITCVVGTRYHSLDIIGHILEKELELKVEDLIQ